WWSTRCCPGGSPASSRRWWRRAPTHGRVAGVTYRPCDGDPPRVGRLTFVPFLPDSSCLAVPYGSGGVTLPSGEVRAGEDWLLDTCPAGAAGDRRVPDAAGRRVRGRRRPRVRVAGRRPLQRPPSTCEGRLDHRDGGGGRGPGSPRPAGRTWRGRYGT